MFKIGDFSKLGQVSVRTLHHYERLKLLRPAWVDRFTGYRYYSPEQLPRLNRILALKDLGFSLEEIRQLLRDDLPAARLREMLRAKQDELERRVQAERERLGRVAARLEEIEREGHLPAYDVVLKQVGAQRVVGVRDRIPTYGDVGLLFARLRAGLQAAGGALPAALPWLALYYDSEYREQGVDAEAAVPLERELAAGDWGLVHELPAATLACAVCLSGESQRKAHHALWGWIQANGFRAQGPNRELYLERPRGGTRPGGLVTEVQIPVEKAPVPSYLLEKEKEGMEPKIVTRPAFTVIGLRYYGRNQQGEIAQLWDEFSRRAAEIPKPVPGAFYGLCFGSGGGEPIEYIAGPAVESAGPVPAGMVSRDVPAQRYAVFTTTLPQLGATYEYIMGTWLPQSGHKLGQGPDFEYYDERLDPQTNEGELDVYVPIE